MYASMLAKAYLTSGIIAEQRILVFSSKIKSSGSRFLKELPSLVKNSTAVDSSNQRSSSSSDESMKIAFRYSNLPSRFAAHQEGEDASAQKLDFGASLDYALVESADIEFYDHSEILFVLKDVEEKQVTADLTQNKTSKITRILIDELGSPLSPLPVDSLPRTLHRIKVLLRRLPHAVCLATLTSDRTTNLSDSSPSSEADSTAFDLLNCISHYTRERIHSHADSVVRLISFPEDTEEVDGEGTSGNPYASDYVGFLHLLRLPRLNSFAPYNSTLESTEYGIKLRNSRRFLAFEKLALPPDLGETVSRFTPSSSNSKTSSDQPQSKAKSSQLPCASLLTNF